MMTVNWTSAADHLLREHYVKLGAAWCAKELGRSFASVTHRAQRLRLSRKRAWTSKDDAQLVMVWGVHSIAQIARAMERTRFAIYWRASQIGLGLGCPQGFEYLSAACRRTGYEIAQLRTILRWGGVLIRCAMSRPRSKGRGHHGTHIVEPTEVDDAVARWCRTEPIEAAARRLETTAEIVRRILRDAIADGDARVPPPPRKAKVHWRIPSDVLDDLFTRDRALETLKGAASRHAMDPRTLWGWLNDAGVSVARGKRLAAPIVDRVVQERLAYESVKQCAERHGRSHIFIRARIADGLARGLLVLPERTKGEYWRLPKIVMDELVAAHAARIAPASEAA